MRKKIRKNKFDFNDMLSQLNALKRMGDIRSLLGMMPGMGKALKDVEIDDKAFLKVEAIIQSMTPQERSNPELLNLSRKKRIARGCGRDINDINMFIRQFDQMRKMMHKMSKMPMNKLGGMMPGGPKIK
ncbi:MAG: hypothetical protein R2784_01305 [Saprospiraceae bacterium]